MAIATLCRLGGYTDAEVWDFTPRKTWALLFLHQIGRQREQAELLQLHLIAAQGEPKKVLKEVQKALEE